MCWSCVDYVWLSLTVEKKPLKMLALSAHITPIQRVPNACPANITYLCLALAMRGVFVNFVALLTRNVVSKRCVFADLYTWFIYNTLYIRLKLAGSSHILTKFMDAQRRTALIFVTPGMGCASCMCDWGITTLLFMKTRITRYIFIGNWWL